MATETTSVVCKNPMPSGRRACDALPLEGCPCNDPAAGRRCGVASDILRPTIEYHGPFATHNMPCAVCRQRPAVLQINDDVFMPCWECRERWELRPRSWWSRLFRPPARNAGEVDRG